MRKISLAAVLAVLLSTLGCGGDGLDRHDLSGMVTFKGAPVPAGSISFRPDQSKGGSGPTGYAKIEDGEFSTYGTGKGAMTGPVKVMIEGAVSKKPMSARLFPIYKTDIEVSGDKTEFDFEVPEQAARVKQKQRKR
ncbi:hypothetical protein [Adhaeretor mobilis]|uniref:Lipoprotein n=1 Tax=Adhaeretor mobilis TaxID=1930276 RepID=A0A517MUE3_9BACT|nr:hypothetical protein [Adhaeretor mobilis]QDS98503.1 hypothetical protein HG15A2_17830 [Adhaeretor mobilis]